MDNPIVPHRLVEARRRTEISSVVSVLISLISDTWANGPHDIKLISLGGGPTTVACYWGSQASPKRCTTAWAWRTPPKQVKKFPSQANL
ncbi:hypothetical protein PRUPE_1G117400 [Prunus persica]|uniref:Uncharacterized protein n=1 Tax=Prunus persica TaxID=3760 RepID=M5Y098_PRUPE|nr:hypothetical protein PRUPE_1G117400 [Prunus persica]